VADAHSKAPPLPSVIERHGGNLKAQICGASYVVPDELELTIMLKGRCDAEVPAMLREYNAGSVQRRPQ